MQKIKQLVCILGAVLLAGIYVITLVFAFTDKTAAQSWLSAALFSTFAVPIFLYAFLLALRLVTGRNASEEEESDPEASEDPTGENKQ